MSRQQNIDLLNQYFTLMSNGEWQAVEDMYHDDIVIHMAGTTPASGRLEGKAAVTDELIAQQVHAALVPEKMHFAKRWKIMCADDERVVAIMEGGGPTVSGDVYDQTYCEIFRFQDGKVIEMHAFFDTALAERALFGNALAVPRDSTNVQSLTY
jgi:ketosteroid isomerase-like protein